MQRTDQVGNSRSKHNNVHDRSAQQKLLPLLAGDTKATNTNRLTGFNAHQAVAWHACVHRLNSALQAVTGWWIEADAHGDGRHRPKLHVYASSQVTAGVNQQQQPAMQDRRGMLLRMPPCASCWPCINLGATCWQRSL